MGFKTAEFNGNRISYHDTTEFLVQVGKDKSKYETRYTFTGNLEQAVMYYRGINIGNGYKKRLVMPSSPRNKGVLARQFS